MALSKKCPSCQRKYRYLLQCSDCPRQFCNLCADPKLTLLPICEKYDPGPFFSSACPKCGSTSYKPISEIDDDDHEYSIDKYKSSSEESDSSDQEETSSESSYSSSDYSGSSDSSDSWDGSTSTGGTSAATPSGSGTGILSIVAVIAIFLFFKYANVGTQQPANSVVVSPPPSPTVSENESAEHPPSPVTLLVSPQEVTALQFYEAGFNNPPKEQRLYTTTFYQNSVRYIYWELTLQTPRQESDLPLNITAVWTGPNGNTEVARQDYAITAPANSDSWWVSFGWGNQNGNAFQPGVYEIAFFVEGRQIANGSVEVLPGRAESDAQTQENAAPEPPAPQLAPLGQPGIVAQPQLYVQPPVGVIVTRPRHRIEVMPRPRNYVPLRPQRVAHP
jgi:hypothetical protein